MLGGKGDDTRSFLHRGDGEFIARGLHGEHGTSIEIDDVAAAAGYMRQRWPGTDLWLAGFSFGAVVAARAALQLAPVRLITVAPAVNILGRELRETPEMPWLIVQGGADEIVPVAEVEEWAASLHPQPSFHRGV